MKDRLTQDRIESMSDTDLRNLCRDLEDSAYAFYGADDDETGDYYSSRAEVYRTELDARVSLPMTL